MKTSSAKAKGRRCAKETADWLYKFAPDLRDGDILVTSSGETGVDLKLSPVAKEVYPLSFECKNQEKLNIWAALSQSESNEEKNCKPIVCFKRNKSELYCALKLEDFLRLVR